MRYLRFIIPAVILIGVLIFVSTSNVTRLSGKAAFSPGENGMNILKLTGPNGWYCIEYSKTVTSLEPGAPLGLAGKGYSWCPMFGDVTIVSNNYPREGVVDNIPLEEPVMIYQNAEGTYEIYVLFARDLSKYEALDG